VAVSGRVLLYAIASSVITGFIFGMAPARMLLSRVGGAQGATGDAPLVEVTFKAVTEAAAIPVELTVASPVGTGGRPLEAPAGAKHELRVEP